MRRVHEYEVTGRALHRMKVRDGRLVKVEKLVLDTATNDRWIPAVYDDVQQDISWRLWADEQ